MSEDTADESSWAEELMDAADAAYDSAAVSAGDAYDSVVESAEKAYDSATETVDQAYDWGAEQAGAAAEWVDENAPSVWEEGADPVPEGAAENSSVLPWVQEYAFWSGMSPGYLNYEGGNVNIDSGWSRDAVASGAFAALAGLIATVAIEFIGLEALIGEFLAGATAPTVAAWRGYEGFGVQRRISCEAVEVHEWYGRYRYNVLSGEILAVDFWGIGPTIRVPTIGWAEERLVDADGNVLFTTAPVMLNERVFVVPHGAAGFDLENQQNLPEWSFGEDQIWDVES